MRELDRVMRAVAVKDIAVTFVGESGSGKDVMARWLHELSPRRGGPFMPINCAAIPETLFESELFGHERGAFTGATERAIGKIEGASGGTLFLDEIAEMPLPLQTKLLRFIEGRRFMRLGGTSKLDADVRLVFATLRPLEAEVKAGRFRADLYYRLQGVVLKVPPLRERRADLPALLDTFIAQLSAIHGTSPPSFPRGVRRALTAYEWPGNIRELRNVVELLCILREGRPVRVTDLPDAIRAAPGPQVERGVVTVMLDRPLDDIIDQIFEAAIAAESGNLTRAARRLQVSVRTLQRRRR
jgi:DNA-binding NtrC family response regulator